MTLPTGPFSTGELATIGGCTRDRVCNVVTKLGIRPAKIIGRTRAFDRTAAELILEECDRRERSMAGAVAGIE